MALLEVSANLKKLLLCSIISFPLTMAAECLGQDTQGKSQTPAGPAGASGQSSSQTAGSLYADYAIGPGDILAITIGDMPDVSGKYRVTDKGYVVLPMLPTPVKAEGLTGLGLSKSIGEALRAAELLREPVVSVYVEEVRSRTVLVLGAVQKPSAYPLDKPRVTVLEALSMAGGLLPQAGNTVTVVRKAHQQADLPNVGAGQKTPSEDQTLTIDLAKATAGKDRTVNVEVHPGDMLTVSTAPAVYVVGAVNKPGGFALLDPAAGVTVLQALAMAEGLNRIAAGDRTVIVRQGPDGQPRQEIPFNVAKLMDGKIGDTQLQPNDILFIPESGTKKSLGRFAAVAVSGAQGAAFYGLGYRVAGIR